MYSTELVKRNHLSNLKTSTLNNPIQTSGLYKKTQDHLLLQKKYFLYNI